MNPLTYTKQFSMPSGIRVQADCIIPPYQGLQAERKPPVLPHREVELELRRRCIQYATYQTTQAPSARGDQVNLDFLGLLDGRPFDDGKVEGFDLILGSKTFIDGFEEQIMGHSAGESFVIDVTFPQQYPAKELCGQKAAFQITLNEVRHLTIPSPSEEIAAKEGYSSLEDWAEAIRRQRIEKRRSEQDAKLQEELLERIIHLAESHIPDSLLQFTAGRFRGQLDQQLAAHKTTLEQYLRRNSLTGTELEAQFIQRARDAITKELVVNGIAEREHLFPTEQEVDREFENFLATAWHNASRQQYPQLKTLLREKLCCRKVGRFLLEHSVAVPVSVE